MCAICYLVADKTQDRQDFQARLRKLALDLNITSSEALDHLLSANMPLDATRADALETLWRGDRDEQRKYSKGRNPWPKLSEYQVTIK